MAPITTVTDYEDATGTTVTDEARVVVLLGRAERYLNRIAGRVWYDAAAPASDASQDWLLAASLVAERSLQQDGSGHKAAVYGAFKAERIGDYSYELRDGKLPVGMLDPDPRVDEILKTYRYVNIGPLAAVLVAAPSRIAPQVYDADAGRYAADVSRTSSGYGEASEQP